MKIRSALAALIPAAAAAALAACGSSSTPPAAPSSPATAPAATAPVSTPPAVTLTDSCRWLAPIFKGLARDLRKSQSHYQEAWISGSYGGPFQQAINNTNGVGTGNQALADAAQFNTDANAYLSQNSPDLYPGWEQQYGVVNADIHAVVSDCTP